MTAQYPSDLLSAVLTKVQGTTERLSPEDLSQVKDLLTRQWPPTVVNMHFWCHPLNGGNYYNRSDDGLQLISTAIGQDRVAEIRIRIIKDQSDKHYISRLTFDATMKDKLSKCLAIQQPVTTGEEEEERKTFLKLRLLDTIHAFYIKALARLPIRQEDPDLLRAILVAGHCYGPMDPVSNIIINSCWYHMAFPLHNQVQNLGLLHHPTLPAGCFDEHAHCCSLPLPYCIIDTTTIARLAIRSLDGLIAALCDGASMSLLQALEFLTTADCDISRALLHPTIFADAAKAAKHPQYVELGSFLSNLLYQEDAVILYGLLPHSQIDSSYPMVTQHLCKILPGISQHKDEEAPLYKLTPTTAGKIINMILSGKCCAF